MSDRTRPPRTLLAGAQYVFEVARQFERLGVLGNLHTLTAFGENTAWARFAWAVKSGPFRGLGSRVVEGVDPMRVHGDPLPELLYFLGRRFGKDPVALMSWRNAIFQRRIPARAIREADAVVGFDTSSWILARRTVNAGKPFLLERSIGHPAAYRKVLEGLAARYPDWECTQDRKADVQIAREDDEHRLATRISAPSRFVERTLIEHGVEPAKIRVNPFGSVRRDRGRSKDDARRRRLRFLFAGTLGVRKGLPVLLEAWGRLSPGRAELLIAGSGNVPTAVRASVPSSVRWLGRLPQVQLLELMGACDAFVFPSFFEGLAQVVVSAAVAGLPIIATPASGAEEVVADGENGWLVSEGDGDALAERIDYLIQHPEKLEAMKCIASERADKWTWDGYGDRWKGILEEAVG